jgi:cytosine/adenosine deaminase-related metal-dependent hydrolase
VKTRILLRGGCVLTLGPKTPNFARGDVLIEGTRVAEVGPAIRARDAEVVDATDTIVMPGFVDTHRHASRSLFRNLGEGSTSGEAPRAAEAIGDRYEPSDVYAATLIGLLGAVEAGITTVVDWSDVQPVDGLVDAALQAHADAGLRTVFVHAARPRERGHGGDDADTISRLAERRPDGSGPSTTIAFGAPEPEPDHLDQIAEDWARARELGWRIHAHAGLATSANGVISHLAGRRLLGPDVTFAHCTTFDDADLDAIRTSGASVSLAPSSEMALGMGPPPIQGLIDRGMRPGLGVGDERMAPGDLFAQMRATISFQHAAVFDLKLAGKAGLPRLMNTRDVIRSATVDGARVAGLGGLTGSLAPGMQADVVVLRTDRPNIFPINDPIGAVVWGMDTSNVDWVFAGGRVLMREGALIAGVEQASLLALAARKRVAGAARLLAGTAREGA